MDEILWKIPDFSYWQDGYGAFTYSLREKYAVLNYVKNQKQHHREESSYDEMKRLLIENEIDYDEKYFD